MWGEIVGHKREISILTKVLEKGELASTYLFSGIDGIGKRKVAVTFAAASICSKDNRPCGTCPDCSKIIKGVHPDLVEVEAEGEGEIKIDDVREIQSRIKYAPISGKRFVIINDAHRMTTSAANAALKILEEPPIKNHFILITSMPSNILPTILSRCQKISFSPLTEQEISGYIVSKFDIPEDVARHVAMLAEGSIGRAINLNHESLKTLINEILDVTRSNDTTRLLVAAERWSKDGDHERLPFLIYLLHRFIHNALLFKLGLKDRWGGTFDEVSAILEARNDKDSLIRKAKVLNDMHWQITKTYNKQLMLEELLFTLLG